MTQFADRVKDTTTTTGAGTITLANSAPARFRTFSAPFAVGTTKISYTIEGQSGSEWETGIGTLLTSSTLSRDTVESSSNSGALVNFSAGTKDVYCSLTAKAVVNAGGGSLQVVATSSLCTSDADLAIGSATFGTDQVAKLQSILDLAANGPLLVIWDGAYSVGAVSTLNALRIRGDTTIRALPGCGLILRNASNVAMLSNYNRSTSTITDKNIRIEGGVWNFNSSGQAKETVANGLVYGMDFVGIDGLALTGGAKCLCGRTYNVHFGNWRNVLIDVVFVDAGPSAPINTDGIHFNGPGQYATVRRVDLRRLGDDAIAFNADDAFVTFNYGPYATQGAISDVVIDDITLDCDLFGIRVLSGASRVDRVSISKIRGRTGNYWLVIDNYVASDITVTGPGNIGSISVDDANVECFDGGSIGVKACVSINCKIEQLSFRNIVRSKFLNATFPTFYLGTKANIGQLLIDGYAAYPYGGGTALTSQISFNTGASVDSMHVVNSKFGAPSAVSGHPMTVPSGVTIKQLLLANNLGLNFTDFLSNAGTVTNLHASGNFMDTTSSASTWVLESGMTEISATSVSDSTVNTAAVRIAQKTTPDGLGGNVQVSGRFTFAGTVTVTLNGALICRGSSLSPWSGATGYYLDVACDGSGPGFVLARKVAGTETRFNASPLGTATSGQSYDMTLTAKLSVITAKIQRVSDGLYLQPAGTWSSTVSNAMTWTDSTIAPASLAYAAYAYIFDSGTSVTVSNFAIAAAP